MTLTMFSAFLGTLGFLACLSLTKADLYCDDINDPNNGEYCVTDSYQESYCCGYNDASCCYYTNVAAVWWFWLLMVLMILFFSVMIAWACRRRRLQHVRRTGYVVIRGQSVTPGSVITTNNAQIAQVTPAGTVYAPYYGAAPPYQGYQNPGGQSSYGVPPPYAPPNAPPPPIHEK